MKARSKLLVRLVALATLAVVTVVTFSVLLAQEPPPSVDRNVLGAFWLHEDADGNSLEDIALCSGRENFRVIWLPPKDASGNYKQADAWEARLTPTHGASSVSYTIQNTSNNPLHPELTGSAALNGFSVVGVEVRGRFDGLTTWRDWSGKVNLYCGLSSRRGGL